MKKIMILCTSLGALLFSADSFARACTSHEYDKAQHYAEKAGFQIIENHLGGQDKRVRLTNCDFNTYSNTFTLNIGIHWNGAMVRSNAYNIDGVLKLSADGSQSSFSKTYSNGNVENLYVFGGITAAALAVGYLGYTASESGSTSNSNFSSTSNTGYNIAVNNRCRKEMSIAINIFNNATHSRQYRGWWHIEPYTRIFLGSNGVRLKTNHSELYFYAEPRDGSTDSAFYFKGTYDGTYDGRSLKMRKISGGYADTEITLC